MDPNAQLWSVEHDTSSDPQPCIDGQSQQTFALRYLSQIWDAYPDVPKFAFLNAIAAHDYSVDMSRTAMGAEAYDTHVAQFIARMLRRADAGNTLIVLRSDHGLQGGPNIIDYSFQREHALPWTTMIIPEAIIPNDGMLDVLHHNTDRLVTGFDIYHTLRNRIDPYLKEVRLDHQKNEMADIDNCDDYEGSNSKISDSSVGEGNSMVVPPIPSWSYDLLTESVPASRTCFDARIASNFCPCMNERNDISPHFRPAMGS